jgi:hypothetical protein
MPYRLYFIDKLMINFFLNYVHWQTQHPCSPGGCPGFRPAAVAYFNEYLTEKLGS